MSFLLRNRNGEGYLRAENSDSYSYESRANSINNGSVINILALEALEKFQTKDRLTNIGLYAAITLLFQPETFTNLWYRVRSIVMYWRGIFFPNARFSYRFLSSCTISNRKNHVGNKRTDILVKILFRYCQESFPGIQFEDATVSFMADNSANDMIITRDTEEKSTNRVLDQLNQFIVHRLPSPYKWIKLGTTGIEYQYSSSERSFTVRVDKDTSFEEIEETQKLTLRAPSGMVTFISIYLLYLFI